MRELLRSNDLVALSWAQAILAGDAIPCVLLDDHVSGVEGSIGAIPRRLMVEDRHFETAQRLLEQARATLASA
jgi:Putative prokaryotic signal transducing protein